MAQDNVLGIPEDYSTVYPTDTDIVMSGFKVFRMINGIKTEVELTCHEVFEVHTFQDHMYYIADVKKTLRELEDMEDDGLRGHTADEIISNEELLDKIVSSYTRKRDKYDMAWYDAAVDAIVEEISKAERTGLIGITAPVSV